MSTPFVGEIRLFGFPRIPNGWLACDGSLLAISEFQSLFSLIGTAYGGDGRNTFAVPDLRGRVPLHQGTGNGLSPYPLGAKGGSETVTLSAAQMPQHTHIATATTASADSQSPTSSVVPGALSNDTMYTSSLAGTNSFQLEANVVSSQGGSHPHDNTMPTLTVSCCIATSGIYPSPN